MDVVLLCCDAASCVMLVESKLWSYFISVNIIFLADDKCFFYETRKTWTIFMVLLVALPLVHAELQNQVIFSVVNQVVTGPVRVVLVTLLLLLFCLRMSAS